MTTRVDLAARAAALTAADSPFVWATVVRAERPTSAKPGDAALIHPDGRIDGFVGGDCAESTVRAEALAALTAGQAQLLRISPEPETDLAPGVISRHNPCLSGGALEIFLEPFVPLPGVAVFGHAPIAVGLLRADGLFGQSVRALESLDAPLAPSVRAVVVASHGNDEVPVLEMALRADVPYVGLVASRRRGAAVLESLAVDDAVRARVHTPAGLDIGAGTAPEVALSILAEIVEVLHGPRTAGPAQPTAVETAAAATDPVCRMSVAMVDASVHLDTASGRVWFCGTGCRDAYRDNPAAYQR
ncbi:MAG: XdhC family protein [Jatrophihabitantaceae bacterium]